MASSAESSLQGFFTMMDDQDGIVVREQPKFDVDLYIQNYAGFTRFDRLLLIGKCCVPLCVEALKAAVAEAKKGSDVSRYKEAWDCIRKAAPNERASVRDDAWIEQVERANAIEEARLENELKGYRNNLIKESIRMGNEDLGKHYYKTGQLSEAADAFGRMRQDVSSNKHLIAGAAHLVDVALRRREWPVVLTNISKITSNNDDQVEKLSNYAAVMNGIATLGQENYAEAARHFLKLQGPLGDMGHIASSNDVAIYGGLLAIASLDRADLQGRVLQSKGFRPILDHEPNMRKAISHFYNGRYSDCLSILESFRVDCLLDIYLQRHVRGIYSRIRSRCITLYFIPFSCVTLESLQTAFGVPGESIEDELVKMIRNGSLNARIDARNKLLVAVRPDPRLELQKNTLAVARRYEEEAQERLRRISLVAAGLEVPVLKNRYVVSAGEDDMMVDEDSNLVPSGLSEEQGIKV